MSSDPKKLEGIDQPRGGDDWGVGQMDDGSIDVIPEDKLIDSVAQRDADESAFAAMLDEGMGSDPVDDDLSDLEDE